jgi:hypothetical protein
MTFKAKALLTALVAVLAIGGVAATATTAVSAEFKWKVKEKILENEKEKEKLTITQTEAFTLEAKPIGVNLTIECPEVKFSAGEITGGTPGTAKATLELGEKCKVVTPEKCNKSKVKTEKIEFTGEIVEIRDAGRIGHLAILFKVSKEPKITLEGGGEECELAGGVTGTVAPATLLDKVEVEKLKLEFLKPAVSKFKNSKAEEFMTELKAFGSKATLSGKAEAATAEKFKWGIF